MLDSPSPTTCGVRIGRFFADLETAEHAEFYRPVATLGRLFIEIETEAFALPL